MLKGEEVLKSVNTERSDKNKEYGEDVLNCYERFSLEPISRKSELE